MSENRSRAGGEHAVHHIVPKSFYRSKCDDGWLDGDWDAPENRVLLTHREHAQCHLWLWERMTAGLARAKMASAIKLVLGKMAAKGIPHKVSVALLERIMREAAAARHDDIIRDWANLDGRTFAGSRVALETWAGLSIGTLKRLTRINPAKTCLDWYIVVPGEAPPLPSRERQGLSTRDTTVYDWTHEDGRTYTDTRRELEAWAGLPSGALKPLTRSNPRKTAQGWRIVRRHPSTPIDQHKERHYGPQT